MKPRIHSTIRAFFISMGALSVILAILGVFLPVLPTTPFLLLAAYFFARSSPTLHRKLLSHKYLGPYIRDWQTHKSLTRKTKHRAILLLWLTTGSSAVFFVPLLTVKILILLVATSVTLYIWRIPTRRD